jgi:recombination protein RecT
MGTHELVKFEKNISDTVLNKISEMTNTQQLALPDNYSAANAIKSAWLMIQEDEKTLKCTKESIANSLLDMVVQGLTPAKKQCYFIPYGNKLTLSRSYMGTVAVTKRVKGVVDVRAEIIYDGDEFEYEIDVLTQTKKITKHKQSFSNIDINKIKGAYAVVIRNDGEPNFVEIMTKAQIEKSWSQGAMKGNSPAHKNFTEEMSKKTVINRACKLFFNTSNDSDLLAEAINRTTEAEYIQVDEVEEADAEVQNKANQGEILTLDEPKKDSISDEEKAKIEQKELEESELPKARF